jgi:hypothetical protein
MGGQPAWTLTQFPFEGLTNHDAARVQVLCRGSYFKGNQSGVMPSILNANSEPVENLQSPAFQCDGRVYCSEMHSRAEAEFFIKHCPNTKMDGDNDGEPCENDSRF